MNNTKTNAFHTLHSTVLFVLLSGEGGVVCVLCVLCTCVCSAARVKSRGTTATAVTDATAVATATALVIYVIIEWYRHAIPADP